MEEEKSNEIESVINVKNRRSSNNCSPVPPTTTTTAATVSESLRDETVTPLFSNATTPDASLVVPTTTTITTALDSNSIISNDNEKLKNENQCLHQQLDQLKLILLQKDGVIALNQREKNILEKEKLALKKQIDQAIKEKENIVIKFATKEKYLLDAKKEIENYEKLLNDNKKEIKNLSIKYQTLNDEKSRLLNIIDEKCNELRKQQKDNEKLKNDVSNLEMKLKWNTLKLTQETEGKIAAEKKLEECHDKSAMKHDEKTIILNEQQRMEQEANLILLKHENEKKDKQIDILKKDNKQMSENIFELENAISNSKTEIGKLITELDSLKLEHESVQNSLSQEMLNSARLRTQLDELRVLQAQNVIKEEKITSLTKIVEELEQNIKDFENEVSHLRNKENELLAINKEMSEMIVGLQNEIYLHSSKATAAEAENVILKKEKLEFDTKYNEIEKQLQDEIDKRNDERNLLTKHISEKTKLYEITKKKLDNALGDLEAIKKKHSQVIKELNREINKYKRQEEERNSNNGDKDSTDDSSSEKRNEKINTRNQSDSETELPSGISVSQANEPTKQHLVERILRLQQAVARQTEKIDFLENHTMSLVSEIQKKSKLLQYYMLRDQAGALTSSRSDQNKSELSKYGGVMSAIYSGLKGNNQSMTLELSLEINRKLQAVLEDTLLKNITLKENLDVLGLEVDKLTRQIAAQKRS